MPTRHYGMLPTENATFRPDQVEQSKTLSSEAIGIEIPAALYHLRLTAVCVCAIGLLLESTEWQIGSDCPREAM